jgi:hypothetical protein
VSSTSQGPAAAAQIVPAGDGVVAGHVAELPEQTASTSQGSSAASHTVPADTRRSGQEKETPSHTSWRSHAPVGAEPQVVPSGAGVLAGHAALEPVQVAATSHGSVAVPQTVPAGSSSDGQVVLPASQ